MRTSGALTESNKWTCNMRLNIPIARMYRGRFLRVSLVSAAVTALTLAGVACADKPVSPDKDALVALYTSTDGEIW